LSCCSCGCRRKVQDYHKKKIASHKQKNKIKEVSPTYKCFVFFKLANDFGIGPDIWFWSICILSKLGRYPSSSGKEPDSWFPFKSLQKQIARILSINGKGKKMSSNKRNEFEVLNL